MKPAAPPPPPGVPPPPPVLPPPSPPPHSSGDPYKTLLVENLKLQQKQQKKKSEEEIILAESRRLSTENLVCFSLYREINSVIQEGPQCGLVALCMAAQVLKCPEPSIESVVNSAQNMGFTKQGEMFSATNMCTLACSMLNCHGLVLKMSSRDCLMKLLTHKRSALLVPYDKDHNNTPCRKQGHTAHWAMVSGAVGMGSQDRCSRVLLDRWKKQVNTTELDQTVDETNNQCVDPSKDVLTNPDQKQDKSDHMDNQMKQSNHLDQIQDTLINPVKPQDDTPSKNPDSTSHPDHPNNPDFLCRLSQPLNEEEATAVTELEHVFVFANQGKSIRTHLWCIRDLVASNHQLLELDPDIVENLDQYNVGEGIVQGLCGQAVFLWMDD